MIRRLFPRAWKVIAIAAVIVMIPVAVLAAVGSFSSSTTTPAVLGRNTSTASGAKGVQGYESGTGSHTRYGVYGSANGTGGIGVQGAGTKYGVFSAGPLGVASGKSLLCGGCVTGTDLAASAKPVLSGGASAGGFPVLTSTCGNLASVTVVAPKSGQILVIGKTVLYPTHTMGTGDIFSFGVGTSSSDCSFEATNDWSLSEVASGLPTAGGDSYGTTVSVMRMFAVTAGSHTYYMNGRLWAGGVGSDTGYMEANAMFMG